MPYDPFARGDLPVGVRTLEFTDRSRSDRQLAVELWYPAAAAERGRDVAAESRDRYRVVAGFAKSSQRAVRDAEAAGGKYPLILFSHGFAGHRRQSTFFTTHLASHGYLVAAVDHAGNTVVDVMSGAASGNFAAAMAARPVDLGFLIESLLGADSVVADAIADDRLGVSGHSFGGWTALATIAGEARVAAALLLAPAGGAARLRQGIDFAWPHPVSTLVIAAERDSVLALAGIRELVAEIPPPVRMVVLDNADHMHFCDAARAVHELLRRMPAAITAIRPHQELPPFDQLCAADHGQLVTCGLGVAHFDAALKQRDEAAALLAGDLGGLLAERGVAVTLD